MAALVTELWSLMGALALLQAFLPPPLRRFLEDWLEAAWGWLCGRFDRHTSIEVHEDVPGSFKGSNLLYRDVEAYLGSLDHLQAADRVRVHRRYDESALSFSLPPHQTIPDSFQGAALSWTHRVARGEPPAGHVSPWEPRSSRRDASHSFCLTLLKSDRPRLLAAYLDHIAAVAKELERRKTRRKLYTNDGAEWEEVDFKHPSTFETLAMAADLKDTIRADLRAFAQGERFYHSVGRPWKRGYLLYGPPGTGKSSMIAAMANFLNYDVYDLELTSVSDNSELKSLLIRTHRKSIIVIEDIDCSLDLSDRGAQNNKDSSQLKPGNGEKKEDAKTAASKVTLSGLLNFTDGLWSCCGEERIFVFTTNHKERLDPALLRSGRMDVHILLSYCTFAAFKVLAANYLGVRGEHKLFPEVETFFSSKKSKKVTPAEVVELLITNKDADPDSALTRVLATLRESSSPNEEGAGATPGPASLTKSRSGLKRLIKLQYLLTRLPVSSGKAKSGDGGAKKSCDDDGDKDL